MSDHGKGAGQAPIGAMEIWISVVLRCGVAASAGIILIGVICLARTGATGYARIGAASLQDVVAFHAATGPGYFPLSWTAILRGVSAGGAYSIIEVGILTLIGTPVLRVALSVLFFLAQRDWLYVAITLFVLGVLLLGLVLGVG